MRGIALPTICIVPTCCPSGPLLSFSEDVGPWPAHLGVDRRLMPQTLEPCPCLWPQIPPGEGEVERQGMERRGHGDMVEWETWGVEGQVSGGMGRGEGHLQAGSLTVLRLQQSRQGQAVAVTGAGVGAGPGMEGQTPGQAVEQVGASGCSGPPCAEQVGRRGGCVLVPCQTCAGPGEGHLPHRNWALCHPTTGASSPTASRQGLGSQWFCESESSAELQVGVSGPNCPGTQVACRPWAQPLLGGSGGECRPREGAEHPGSRDYGVGARRGLARTSGLPSDQRTLEKACPPIPAGRDGGSLQGSHTN